jgi:hypothetical protein
MVLLQVYKLFLLSVLLHQPSLNRELEGSSPFIALINGLDPECPCFTVKTSVKEDSTLSMETNPPPGNKFLGDNIQGNEDASPMFSISDLIKINIYSNNIAM